MIDILTAGFEGRKPNFMLCVMPLAGVVVDMTSAFDYRLPTTEQGSHAIGGSRSNTSIPLRVECGQAQLSA